MKGKQHLLLGVCAGLAVAEVSQGGGGQRFTFLVSCCIGSLAPDIDIPESKIGSMFKPLSIVINRVFGHRGFFHSLVCAVFLSFLISFVFGKLMPDTQIQVIAGFLSGYFLHLVQDSCTRMGVKLFWPIPKYFHVPLLTSHNENNFRYWLSTVAIFILWCAGCFLYTIVRQHTFLVI